MVRAAPKPKLFVPHTLLMTKGAPSAWFFTSRRVREGYVLKKRPEHTTLHGFFKEVCAKYSPATAETICLEGKISDKQLPESILEEPVLWLISASERRAITGRHFIELIKNLSHLNDVCFQDIVTLGHRRSETYFVEYEVCDNDRVIHRMTLAVEERITGRKQAEPMVRVLSKLNKDELALQA
jgi:hypothetical protein